MGKQEKKGQNRNMGQNQKLNDVQLAHQINGLLSGQSNLSASIALALCLRGALIDEASHEKPPEVIVILCGALDAFLLKAKAFRHLQGTSHA